MTQTSSLLNLPYIEPSQAQKHVTHNESLRILDTLTHLRVITTACSNRPVRTRPLLGCAATTRPRGRPAAGAATLRV